MVNVDGRGCGPWRLYLLLVPGCNSFLFLYHMKNQSLPLPMLPKITAQKALTIPIACLLHQENENLSKIWVKVTNREAVFASLEPGAEIIDFGDEE